MKKIILLLTALFIFGCSSSSDISESIERQRALLPKPVNSFITWTDIQIEKKEIQNSYLIIEEKLAVPLSAVLLELKTVGRQAILQKLNASPSTRRILTDGFTYRYIYKNLKGDVLHEFVIGKDDLT